MIETGYTSYPALKQLTKNARTNTEIALRSFMWGVNIDREYFNKIDLEVQNEAAKAKDKLTEILPPDFNLRSGKQLTQLLYEQLGEPVTFRTDSNEPATNKKALEHIKAFGESEQGRLVAESILAYKKWQKRLDTYVAPYRDETLIRPRPVPCEQISGRWSYREPALQTWPKFMKGMFVPRKGNYFVACDYSQAELRVIAVHAGDEPLLKAYANGVDVHAANAGDLFGVDMQKIKKPDEEENPGDYTKFRNIAKMFAFALNYSTMDDDIAAKTILTRLHAAGFTHMTFQLTLIAVKRWWAAHPALKRYKDSLWAFTQKSGYVEEPWSGRRRFFYGKPKDTEVFNFPLQGGVAHFMDGAAQGIDREMDHSREGLIVQVHDALVIETPEPEKMAYLMRKHMRQTIKSGNSEILLNIDCAIGDRYGSLKSFKFAT